jgi:phage-related protein
MDRIDRKLGLLEELGTRLDPPHVDHLRGKIWELRVTGKIQHRILYVAIEGKRILLLHGFTKKRQKTPAREIEIAESRYRDFLERNR